MGETGTLNQILSEKFYESHCILINWSLAQIGDGQVSQNQGKIDREQAVTIGRAEWAVGACFVSANTSLNEQLRRCCLNVMSVPQGFVCIFLSSSNQKDTCFQRRKMDLHTLKVFLVCCSNETFDR